MLTELAIALVTVTAVWARDLYFTRQVLARQERELDERIRKFEEERRAHARRGVYR